VEQNKAIIKLLSCRPSESNPIVAVHLTSSDEETLPVPGISTEERENTPPRQSFTDSSDSSDSANGSDSTETEDDPLGNLLLPNIKQNLVRS